MKMKAKYKIVFPRQSLTGSGGIKKYECRAGGTYAEASSRHKPRIGSWVVGEEPAASLLKKELKSGFDWSHGNEVTK